MINYYIPQARKYLERRDLSPAFEELISDVRRGLSPTLRAKISGGAPFPCGESLFSPPGKILGIQQGLFVTVWYTNLLIRF
jgi:hypothetical protein